jgi:uncharacterized SAM-binding protein YcdF (DUF218 family)
MLNRCLRVGHILLVALGALMVVIHATPVVRWWAQALTVEWNEPRGAVLIVLAGSSLTDGTMGGSTYWRMVYASRAWHQAHFREVLLCGGPASNPVARSMRSFLIAEGVPPENIRLDTTSVTTRENAINAAALLASSPPGERMLLTSDFHMLRSWLVLRKAGIRTTPCPIPDALKRAARLEGCLSAFIDLIRETSKLAYYRAHGWI